MYKAVATRLVNESAGHNKQWTSWTFFYLEPAGTIRWAPLWIAHYGPIGKPGAIKVHESHVPDAESNVKLDEKLRRGYEGPSERRFEVTSPRDLSARQLDYLWRHGREWVDVGDLVGELVVIRDGLA